MNVNMADDLLPPDDLDRYARQIRYPALGEAGQRRLCVGRVLVCGCGALGNVVAAMLVRAGAGAVRIVDRDLVDASNLHRQLLFDEEDAAEALPKAVAAARKLARASSTVRIEPIVADVTHRNVESLCEGVDVIVDGTDNFQTRFLLNDTALALGIPWIYGGCLGAQGQSMTILPRETACLRCLMPQCPAPGDVPTCETAGILAPIVGVIASIEAMEAIKILSGHPEAVSRSLAVVDLWDGQLRQIDLAGLRDRVDCPACKRGEYPWLSGREGAEAAVLCGRNAVQLSQPAVSLSLDELAERLSGVGRVVRNEFLLRLEVAPYVISIFPDGRAIVAGASDPATARAVWAKYVGS